MTILSSSVLLTLLVTLVSGAPAPNEEHEGQTGIPTVHCDYNDVVVPAGYTIATICGMSECVEDADSVGGAYLRSDTCDPCDFHGKLYQHAAMWWDMCNKCTCYNTTIECEQRKCEGTCQVNGVTMVTGDRWNVDCNECECTNEGKILCSDTVCSCEWNGETYVNNQVWDPTGMHDICQCKSGVIIGDLCKKGLTEQLDDLLLKYLF